MMQKVLLFILILILSEPLKGQQLVISENLKADTIIPAFGANRKHFGHIFFGLHHIAGEPELNTDNLSDWSSWAFEFGYRYKRRFSQTLSAGAELSVKRMSHSIKHWAMLNTPEATEIEKHKFIFTQTGLGLYQRFNYNKRRGNFIGNYIDVGVYGDWNINARQIYKFRNTADEKVVYKKSNLDYINPFEYGILTRLGFNKFAAKASYRLSDHFDETSALGEFPRLTFGVEFGMIFY
ncbi:MAG: outer membrane beta-barrel protein [Bacteroidales bacterium]|nr:outer membrane beta-barrel protein [Bacteroidales bacterium]